MKPLFDTSKAISNCKIAEDRFNAMFAGYCAGTVSEAKMALCGRELERRQMVLRMMCD